MLKLVTCDLFCVVSRLKSINSKYHVFYNSVQNAWEIHNSCNPTVLTLQIRVPFDILDERTLEHIWITRVENAFELEEEISVHNNMLEKSACRRMYEEVMKIEDMFEYAIKTSHDVEFDKTIQWL